MAHDVRIGRTLGPYDIEETLGGGGMATVYRGVHRSLGAQRNIKVMSSGPATHHSFVELFCREARLAAGLRHPNIVQIFDIAQHDGLHYLVMELLEGRSLHDVIRQDAPIPLPRVLHQVGQPATIVRVLPTVQATISSFVFRPDPIVVEAGQSIRWTNLDPAVHTVTADDLSFTSPILSQGETFTLTLMQPGTYGYFCEPHPQMAGTIVVQ